MLVQARALNPDITFHEGNMLALGLSDGSLAGIAAFYVIVNLPKASWTVAFREMERVLQADGRLLVAFHVGNEALHGEQLWGLPIAMDFFLLQPSEVRNSMEAAALEVEEIVERGPYCPEVEYPSQRAYIFARKPGTVRKRQTPHGA
jgi:hypothetical protein